MQKSARSTTGKAHSRAKVVTQIAEVMTLFIEQVSIQASGRKTLSKLTEITFTTCLIRGRMLHAQMIGALGQATSNLSIYIYFSCAISRAGLTSQFLESYAPLPVTRRLCCLHSREERLSACISCIYSI